MKTAIYIEDGVTQVVLTPETEFEKKTVAEIQRSKTEAHVFHGSFYDCQGGWIRQKEHYQTHSHFGNANDASLMIKLTSRDENDAKENQERQKQDWNLIKFIDQLDEEYTFSREQVLGMLTIAASRFVTSENVRAHIHELIAKREAQP